MLWSWTSCFGPWKGRQGAVTPVWAVYPFSPLQSWGQFLIPEMLHYLAVFMKQKEQNFVLFCVSRGGVAFWSWFLLPWVCLIQRFGAWWRRQGVEAQVFILLPVPWLGFTFPPLSIKSGSI